MSIKLDNETRTIMLIKLRRRARTENGESDGRRDPTIMTLAGCVKSGFIDIPSIPVIGMPCLYPIV